MVVCLREGYCNGFCMTWQGALYFGMEMALLKCRTWLTDAVSASGTPLVQLNDLFSIWEFGSEIGEFAFATYYDPGYIYPLHNLSIDCFGGALFLGWWHIPQLLTTIFIRKRMISKRKFWFLCSSKVDENSDIANFMRNMKKDDAYA